MNGNPQPNAPPYPAFRATEKECFAYDSTVRRWPIILDSALKYVKESLQNRTDAAGKESGRVIIEKIEALKDEIAKDNRLRYLNDAEKDTESWNELLEKQFKNVTWFNGTWLFNECYMYRRLAECFNKAIGWHGFDPFEQQKIDTFRGSYAAVFELAQNIPDMMNESTPGNRKTIFNEIIQVCLWGNATDLSLLTNMTESDIQRLQSVGNGCLKERKKFLLVDDSDKLWEKVEHITEGRVDFVLDNSGFEVFVDLILADWLLQTKTASKVFFHCKTIPWFVSDVMCKDVNIILESCLNRTFFPAGVNRPIEQIIALEAMAKRWKDYITEGALVLQDHDFWCSGLSYWHFRTNAPELFENMSSSDLVIFKGDLNFRKLVYDCDWPITTPFKEAIGHDLANCFTSILSLRTNKADTIVGLTEEKKKDMEQIEPMEWRCSGKYAVIEFNNCDTPTHKTTTR